MKIGFIGGSGHHPLRACLGKGAAGAEPVEAAVANDGADRPAAEQFAKNHGITRWFDDARQMMDLFKPDIVSIGAVYAHNGKWAAEALRRGIPASSDKPIAATWEQLKELQQLSSSGVIITEFGCRSQKEFLAARDAVRQGLIGKPVLITAQKSYRFATRPAWYGDRASYGGTVLWVASHMLDAIPFIVGESYSGATGRGGNIAHPDFGSMEDHVTILAAMKNGASAVVHADYLRPAAAGTHGDDRLRIAGSQGVLEIREDRCRLVTMDQPEIDITDRIAAKPFHENLLAGLQGKSELYSTAQSLAMAETLLRCRDAVDQGKWLAMAPPKCI